MKCSCMPMNNVCKVVVARALCLPVSKTRRMSVQRNGKLEVRVTAICDDGKTSGMSQNRQWILSKELHSCSCVWIAVKADAAGVRIPVWATQRFSVLCQQAEKNFGSDFVLFSVVDKLLPPSDSLLSTEQKAHLVRDTWGVEEKWWRRGDGEKATIAAGCISRRGYIV